jgi:hypothetical protein
VSCVKALSARALCQESVDFLLEVWSPELGLFPYSTSVSDGLYVNDYRRPAADRYTVNTLLGLQEASGVGLLPERDSSALVERFLERCFHNLTSPSDLGLLLVLLRDQQASTDRREALERLVDLATSKGAGKLDLQTLGWMLWGLSVAASTSREAERAAQAVFQVISGGFVDPSSDLARHSVRLYRRGLVSFGSTVYFLRAMHEYAALSDDTRAEALFENGVRRMVHNQGPNGEWPWLYSVRRGVPVEYYPVFAVHQDAMAMLFLLPALDRGMTWVREPIARSVLWVFGCNELDTPTFVHEPFRAYRSIERTHTLPRTTRYFRSLGNLALGKASNLSTSGRVRINPECRSYHLGWFLYVWSSRLPLLDEIMSRRVVQPLTSRLAS